MTNGTQLQPGGATAVPAPSDPSDALAPLAGAAPPAGPRVPRPRQPLTVIPRRATGTWAAVPRPPGTAWPDATTAGLPAVPEYAAATGHATSTGPAAVGEPGAGHRLPTPSGLPRPGRRRLLVGGAALAAVGTAVAAVLWLPEDRPGTASRGVVPVQAGEPTPPGDPSAAAGPQAPATPTAAPTPDGSGTPDPSAEADAAPEPTRPTETQRAQRPDRQPPQQAPADRPAAPGRSNTEGRNLALDRPVSASSFDSRFHAPSFAVDGNVLSRWSSIAGDPQWIAVDLGARWQISKISIVWELANANTYRVELSSDGRSWTPVYETRTGLGGTVAVPVDDVSARYVRLYGTQRAGLFGYSVRELDVR